MSKETWLAHARVHREKLISLIRRFHPSSPGGGRLSLPITAPNAELACEVVREHIAKTEHGDPVMRFERALAEENILDVVHVLNATWFGVPESTSCWQLRGFPEAVELLEEQPDSLELYANAKDKKGDDR